MVLYNKMSCYCHSILNYFHRYMRQHVQTPILLIVLLYLCDALRKEIYIITYYNIIVYIITYYIEHNMHILLFLSTLYLWFMVKQNMDIHVHLNVTIMVES